MPNPDYSDLNADIIDVTPARSIQRRLFRQYKWIALAIIVLFVALWRGAYLYTDSLWYGSLGFSSRFWYVLALGWGLFAVFATLTFIILRGGLYLLERWFRVDALVPRKILVNKQLVQFNPSTLFRPISWLVSIV